MPALRAFGTKWRIGSDDFVFPYAGTILVRFIWFVVVGYVMLVYDSSKYTCDDEQLLKIYLFVLTGLHICMCLTEMVVVLISAQGTIANPEPRKSIHIALYVQMGFFVLEFAWDIIGVIWAFDPSIECHRSHPLLLLTKIVLVWNITSSLTVALYMVLRIGLCRLACCCNPPKKLRYERLSHSTSFRDSRLTVFSSDGLLQHHRQRTWQWRLKWLCGCVTLREDQQGVIGDVAATLAHAFTHFRGYVPSDIIAGMALLAKEQRESKHTDWEDSHDYTRQKHVDFHWKQDYSPVNTRRKALELHSKHTDQEDENTRKKNLDFHCEDVCKHFNKVVRYMKFAAGTYGWRSYFTNKGIVPGLCKLMCSKKQKQTGKENGLEEGEVEESEEQQLPVRGDKWGWNIAALKYTAGLQDEDLVYASFTSEVFCPAFYVAYDHQEEAIVVAIRGSMTVQDVLTQLSAELDILSTSESGDTLAHRGMMCSAHAVQLKLESQNILERAFAEYPGYHLVLTGHSLGAGVASLLAVLFKPKHPTLHCYAYSPPGCVISMSAIPHTRSFITSVVVGNDFLARLTFQSFETFSDRVLHCIQTSHLPKYRIFLDSFLSWLGLCRTRTRGVMRRFSVTELIIQREPLLNVGFDKELPDNYVRRNSRRNALLGGALLNDPVNLLYKPRTGEEEATAPDPTTDLVTGKQKVQPKAKTSLFLPGRIIHITQGASVAKWCGLCKHRPLCAHWTAQSEFSELVLGENMVKHHMPGTVLKALLTLQTQENTLTTA